MKRSVWILLLLMAWMRIELMAQAGGNASGSSKGNRAAQQSQKQARDIPSNGSPALSKTNSAQISSGSQASGQTTDKKMATRRNRSGAKTSKNQ